MRTVEDHKDQLDQRGGLEPQPTLPHHLYRLLGLKRPHTYIHLFHMYLATRDLIGLQAGCKYMYTQLELEINEEDHNTLNA